MRKKPELLAPAGSPDALTAAVRCGADAVYLGAGSFNARQSAHNFDETTLREAVAYCHARGVLLHMTLNTLVREEEFADALALAKTACELGVDALIVQDRGLARAIHRAAPTMPLHASTQLSCHTPEGVRQLCADGFSRVVLAREMSREEIAACTHLGCEIEVFVHGALCMSVSGQCLLSAMLGGRSGNRGRCAQPCRLPFSATGKPTETDRCLSLKDLSLCDHIRELAQDGVCSLKIEGRMKRPEYVAAATAVCRAAIDGNPVDPQLSTDLAAVFSRSGFTDGYYENRRDAAMFGSRTKEDVAAAAPALRRLARLYDREPARVPLSVTLTAHAGQPLTLTASDAAGHTVTVCGEKARVTDRPPLPDSRLRQQLQKFGGTPFWLSDEAATVLTDGRADVPLAAVNALRREAAEQLLALRAQPTPHPFLLTKNPLPPCPAPTAPMTVVRLANTAQWSEALSQSAALIVVPLATHPSALSALCAHGKIGVELPRGLFGQSAAALTALQAAKAAGACAALCHTADAVRLANEAALPPIGGFGLHTYNRETVDAFAEDGLRAVTLSAELTLRQMAQISAPSLPIGAFAYGRQPLMLLRNCPRKAARGCNGCHGSGTQALTDRMGVRFLLMCADGCSDLLNSVPTYLGDKLNGLPLHFWLLYMTDESADRVNEVVAACTAHLPAATLFPNGGFTRGFAVRGVE